MSEREDRATVWDAIVHRDANVDPWAAIGHPAEWRGQASMFPAVIEEHATVSEFATVQMGVRRRTVVGRNAWIQAGAYVGHDAQIGGGTDVSPNAVVGGGVTIGDGCKIYSGAVISPNVTIGDGAIIAANSVVTRDVPQCEVWGGAPARYIRDREPA